MSDRATPEPPAATARVPLRLKLTALTVALALVPIPAVGGALLARAQGAIEDQVRELQLSVADEVTAAVEHETSAARDALETLSRVLLDPALPEDRAVASALRLVEGHAAIDHVAIYDGDGELVDRLREDDSHGQTPDRLERAVRAEATERGVARASVDGAHLVVVPMRVEERATGWLAAPVSLDALERRVTTIAEHRFGGREESVVVIDRDGAVIAGGAPGTDLASHPLVRDLGGPRFGTTFAHQRVYDTARGAQIGSLVSLPSRRWGVLVQVPTAVAFAPVAEMRIWVVATVAAMALLALLLGLWVARSITAPLGRLTELAHKLGRRELGTTVDVETRDELHVLGSALSRASVDLAESDRRIRREEAIRADLGRYVSAEIVDRVVAREQDMRLGGVRQTITVLFADVVAFTPLTEEKDPEEVVAVLNELFTILTEIVFRHGGTVDKFIGDCVMALFGAPEPSDDHARRALAAAEDMLVWLESGNAGWQERHGITVKLAIGVHSGEAIVGNVGSESRMTYTAIGDVVNVAARLEAIARPDQILATRETLEAAGEGFEYVDVGPRRLSGRREPVHLVEVRT